MKADFPQVELTESFELSLLQGLFLSAINKNNMPCLKDLLDHLS